MTEADRFFLLYFLVPRNPKTKSYCKSYRPLALNVCYSWKVYFYLINNEGIQGELKLVLKKLSQSI